MIYAIHEGVTVSKTPHNKFHGDVNKILKELQSKLEVMDIPSGFMGMQKGNVLGNVERFQKSFEIAFKKVQVAASNYSVSINVSDLSLKDATKTSKTIVNDVIKSLGYTEKTNRSIGDKLLGHRYMYKKLDNNTIAVCDPGINSTYYPAEGTHNSSITITFKCCDITDKTKKALGLKEETILYGEEADSFLESNSIIIYNNAISINGDKMNGFEAQAMLAENGIILNDDHIVLEGKQAEEYKARKAKEKEEEEKNNNDRYKRRYKLPGSSVTGDKGTHHNPNTKESTDEDDKRFDKSSDIAIDEREKRKNNDTAMKNYRNIGGLKVVQDKVNKDMRRHPEKYAESVIFKYADLE